MIAIVGVTLGLTVTAVTITAIPIALRHLGSASPLVVPWQTLLATVGGTVLLVLAPSPVVGSIAFVRHRLRDLAERLSGQETPHPFPQLSEV